MVTLSAPMGHLPLEGKATIREYHLPRPFLWKGLSSVARRGWLSRMWKACGKYIPPRTVIPSAVEGSLLHCRHMHACALSQTTPWCFLLSPFSHSRVTGLQEGSLHFGPHDKQNTNHFTSFFIPLRRVVPLRGTLSCAFGAGRLASQEGALMGRLGASLD